jgi:hypothetical protein
MPIGQNLIRFLPHELILLLFEVGLTLFDSLVDISELCLVVYSSLHLQMVLQSAEVALESIEPGDL